MAAELATHQDLTDGDSVDNKLPGKGLCKAATTENGASRSGKGKKKNQGVGRNPVAPKKSRSLVAESKKTTISYPARVTRSTSKLLATVVQTPADSLSPSTDHISPNSAPSVDGLIVKQCSKETHQITRSAMKHNRLPDSSVAANCSASKGQGDIADKETEHPKSKQAVTLNAKSGNSGSHFDRFEYTSTDYSLTVTDSCSSSSSQEQNVLQPLCDISNNVIDKLPLAVSSSRRGCRVYELVAGKKKKAKKTKRYPPTACTKKPSSVGETENEVGDLLKSPTASKQLLKNRPASPDHCSEAHQQLAMEEEGLVCNMFAPGQYTTQHHLRVFKSNEHESKSNFHTLFQDDSDIFL